MMFLVPRTDLHHSLYKTLTLYHILTKKSPFSSSIFPHHLHPLTKKWNYPHHLAHTQIPISAKNPIFIPIYQRYVCFSSTRKSSKPLPKSLKRRIRKRFLAATKPVFDISRFNTLIAKLPPRFYPEDLHRVLVLEDDPLVCWELFNWATKQHRFEHNELTFEVTIKRLGDARMLKEMDFVVNQVLAVPLIGTESLYNLMIYYFTQMRMLSRAAMIFRRMRDNRRLSCRPTLTTYNILFYGLLSRGKNSYVNYVYMDNSRCLFKQMVDDGIEPDINALNHMIKGYVLALHVNEALRIFHQMGVVYECKPNSVSYNCIIHGLCVQGRTKNAIQLCNQMKDKGFVPSSKAYNSVINALALGGEVDEAVKYLWELLGHRREAQFITYHTVTDELCRQKNVKEARCLLEDLLGKHLIGEQAYRRLIDGFEGNSTNMRSIC